MSPLSHIEDLKTELQKWIRIVYVQKKHQNEIKSKISSRAIDDTMNPFSFFSEIGDNDFQLYQAMGPDNYKTAMRYRKNNIEERPETFVPKWDISVTELQPFYDETRSAKLFNWEYAYTERWKCPNNNQNFIKMITATYNRMIPWLYVKNGNIYLYRISI